MDLRFITPDLLNDISWFDGIMYIILGLVVYAIIRYINKKRLFHNKIYMGVTTMHFEIISKLIQ